MKRLGPLGILLATVALFSVFQAASVAIGTSDPESIGQLTSSGLALAFVLWVMEDARRHRRTPCFDFGFLVAVGFPVSLAWYVLWSRGRRGMLMLAAFAGLMFLPWLSAVAVWLLRYRLT